MKTVAISIGVVWLLVGLLGTLSPWGIIENMPHSRWKIIKEVLIGMVIWPFALIWMLWPRKTKL